MDFSRSLLIGENTFEELDDCVESNLNETTRKHSLSGNETVLHNGHDTKQHTVSILQKRNENVRFYFT